ncbi:MAG: choice-of-anchor tandem repeat GloVer-containing protein [Bacteroidia bacterium]
MNKIVSILVVILFSALFTNAQYAPHKPEASGANGIGMTSGGGSKGFGVVFQYDIATGNDHTPVHLNGKKVELTYGNPVGNLIQATDGKLYGMAMYGGNKGTGVAFYYNPATGKDSVFISFDGPNGAYPTGSFFQASNGLLYGMTDSGGTSNNGVFFSYNIKTGKDSIIQNFDDTTNGSNPLGNLIQASNGWLYGMTSWGGDSLYKDGVIFTYNPATGKDSVFHDFQYYDGASPEGTLFQASNGWLYGMAYEGGSSSSSDGTLFCIDPKTGYDSVIFNFDSIHGEFPYFNSLMQAKDGKLYGLVNQGGDNDGGGLFMLDPVNGLGSSVFLSLDDIGSDYPAGSLIQAKDGLLYGMSEQGGYSNYGSFFCYNPVSGIDSIVFDFNGNNGAYPYGSLVQDSNGLLYGMTYSGGHYGYGVIFSYNIITHKDSVVFNFSGAVTNNNCFALASDGLLYGMSLLGGTNYYGDIFSFNPTTGTNNILYSFDSTSGQYPYSGLVQASDSLLYGMTEYGGSDDEGVLFSFDSKTNKESVLVNFTDNNGGYPLGNLMQATNGLLYGMTQSGGTNEEGVVFSFDPATGKDSILVNLIDNIGTYPYGGLIQASNGLLYGMTNDGGLNYDGVIFSLNPGTKKYTAVYSFNDSTSGESPYGNLVEASNGLLYGMTNFGGKQGDGVLFSFDTKTNTEKPLMNFTGANGANPTGPLVLDSSGTILYGTASVGGKSNYGVLFNYNTITGKDSVLFNFSDTNGADPTSVIIIGGFVSGEKEIAHPDEIILVYPNPAITAANVLFNNQGSHYIEMYSSTGMLVRTMECNSQNCEIPRNELASGIYFLKFFDSNHHYVSSSKIVLQ